MMGYAAMMSHAVAACEANQLHLLHNILVCCYFHVGFDEAVHSLYFFFRTGIARPCWDVVTACLRKCRRFLCVLVLC